MAKFAALLGALALVGVRFRRGARTDSVADALKNVRVLAIPASARPVDRTVAEEFRRDLAPQAEIRALGAGRRTKKGASSASPSPTRNSSPVRRPTPSEKRTGKAGCSSSSPRTEAASSRRPRPHLLYALYSPAQGGLARASTPPDSRTANASCPAFARLEGGDNYLANPEAGRRRLRSPRRSVRELARLGFSHVPGERPGQGHAGRAGAARERSTTASITSAPTSTSSSRRPLNAGAYSPEYLEANLAAPQGERPPGGEVRPDARSQHQLAPLGARRRPRKIPLPPRRPRRPSLPELSPALHADAVPSRRPLALCRAHAAADARGPRARLHLPLDERQRLGFRVHGQPLRRPQRRRLPRPRVEVPRSHRQGRGRKTSSAISGPCATRRPRRVPTSASSSTSSPSRTRRNSSSTA
ncbi:MAG: hypothetical protein MZV64_12665 [Ignavibacteriales bacterium]|nr:hypothetical protein [Ignavibacteriales bacterium]